MGMDSSKLSARTKQPGHDRSFEASEANFVDALRIILPDETLFVVDPKPRDLSKLLGGRYGVIPEASIEYRPNGHKMYFEVKKQGERGNAEERACKHHTVQFYKTLREHTGYSYHPYATIMCESLATDERYTIKHPFFFEDGHYFEWVGYGIEPLRGYIEGIVERFLKPVATPTQELPT